MTQIEFNRSIMRIMHRILDARNKANHYLELFNLPLRSARIVAVTQADKVYDHSFIFNNNDEMADCMKQCFQLIAENAAQDIFNAQLDLRRLRADWPDLAEKCPKCEGDSSAPVKVNW